MIAENGIRSHSSRHDAAGPLLAAERRLRAQLAVTFTPSRSESANGRLLRAATDVREQRRIEDELEQLGEQLRALEPADERLVGPAETSVKDLRAVLAAGEQLIAYTVTAEAVLAWVCTELALEVLALPVSNSPGSVRSSPVPEMRWTTRWLMTARQPLSPTWPRPCSGRCSVSWCRQKG